MSTALGPSRTVLYGQEWSVCGFGEKLFCWICGALVFGGPAAVGVVGTMEIVVVLAIAIAICGSSGTGWGNDDRRWSSAASAVVTVSDGDGWAVGPRGCGVICGSVLNRMPSS